MTSVCLICVSHVVNLVYWAVRRLVNPMVNYFSNISMVNTNTIQKLNKLTVNSQILQAKEGSSKAQKLLFQILPYVPTTLPTLLFCRITELTILLEGSNPVAYELWEEMVQERSQLMDVSNDIKMIGKRSESYLSNWIHTFLFQKLFARRLENW